jgi:hypothetical protein
MPDTQQSEPYRAIRELSKVAIINALTIFVAWS